MVRILNLDDITEPACPLAIYRGSFYSIGSLFHPDDITAYSICGEIRDNYVSVAGSNLLATFNFEALVYGSVTLADNTVITATTIIPFLPASATDTLTPTRDRKAGDIIRIGRNAYVYDIIITSPTPEEKKTPLVRGIVQVLPNVSTCL